MLIEIAVHELKCLSDHKMYQSSSFAQFRHYHYGVMLTKLSEEDKLDGSMDIFIPELKKNESLLICDIVIK